MTATPATRRINRGRGHSYELDGQRATGVTTALREGFPKPALVDAAAKVGGEYVLNRWDDLVRMEPADRYKAVYKAYADKWFGLAIRGTELHDLAQRHLAGEEVEVAEHLRGHFESYEKFVEDWEPNEVLVEAPVFHREFQYAGTCDLVADLNDGKRWLLDYKTSKSEPWPEVALQLAAYKYAQFYIVEGDLNDAGNYIEHPMPDVDRCGIIWVRADGYDLIPIRADREAFEVFGYTQMITRFRADQKDNWVGKALQPPDKE